MYITVYCISAKTVPVSIKGWKYEKEGQNNVRSRQSQVDYTYMMPSDMMRSAAANDCQAELDVTNDTSGVNQTAEPLRMTNRTHGTRSSPGQEPLYYLDLWVRKADEKWNFIDGKVDTARIIEGNQRYWGKKKHRHPCK